MFVFANFLQEPLGRLFFRRSAQPSQLGGRPEAASPLITVDTVRLPAPFLDRLAAARRGIAESAPPFCDPDELTMRMTEQIIAYCNRRSQLAMGRP